MTSDHGGRDGALSMAVVLVLRQPCTTATTIPLNSMNVPEGAADRSRRGHRTVPAFPVCDTVLPDPAPAPKIPAASIAHFPPGHTVDRALCCGFQPFFRIHSALLRVCRSRGLLSAPWRSVHRFPHPPFAERRGLQGLHPHPFPVTLFILYQAHAAVAGVP